MRVFRQALCDIQLLKEGIHSRIFMGCCCPEEIWTCLGRANLDSSGSFGKWNLDPWRYKCEAISWFSFLQRHTYTHWVNEDSWEQAGSGCYAILHLKAFEEHLLYGAPTRRKPTQCSVMESKVCARACVHACARTENSSVQTTSWPMKTKKETFSMACF